MGAARWAAPPPDAEGRITIPEAVLRACDPQQTSRAAVVRVYCPVHGSDHQRSMTWDQERGSFYCHQCHAKGFTEESRTRWRQEHAQERQSHCWQCREVVDTEHAAICPHCGWMVCPSCSACADPRRVPGGCPGAANPEGVQVSTIRRSAPEVSAVRVPEAEPLHPARPDLADLLARFRAALPGSPGERYLAGRGIPLAVAQAAGIGYASAEDWPGRHGEWGRVVFPLTDRDGRVLNLYGRSVNPQAAKGEKHDILSGGKGWFGAGAIPAATGPLVVTEGPMDALTLAAAGIACVVALLGTAGWRWPWLRGVRGIVLALDGDQAGQDGWRAIARDCAWGGRVVAWVPPAAFGGHDDPAAAWQAGVLDIAAIREEIEGVEQALAHQPSVEEAFDGLAPSLAPSRPQRPAPSPPAPVPAAAASSVAPPPEPAPFAPSARGAPGDALAAQVSAWAAERCQRTTEHSASLDGLLADYRHWSGGERVDPRAFELALEGAGAVVHGHAVVAGLVLR